MCTGCAVTDRFVLKTKYFYNEENLQAFREQYAAMSVFQKAQENRLLAGGIVLIVLLIVGVLVGALAVV